MQMSGKPNYHHQYKPLDETTTPAEVAATKDKDGDVKKGCTRCVRMYVLSVKLILYGPNRHHTITVVSMCFVFWGWYVIFKKLKQLTSVFDSPDCSLYISIDPLSQVERGRPRSLLQWLDGRRDPVVILFGIRSCHVRMFPKKRSRLPWIKDETRGQPVVSLTVHDVGVV